MKPFPHLHRILVVALVACIALVVPARAGAQALYGSLTGSVTDNTGAAIPGVSVTVTNEGTGLKLDTVTDGEGVYAVRNVLPGTYTLTAALQGFKNFTQTGIPLTAGNILRINATLEIGDLTESITVTTEAALLKTDKADVSVELQPKEITDLPLNQFRNYQALMNLVPGATPGAFQNSQGSTPQRSLSVNVNGVNRNNNSTRIDGAASINIWLPHHAGMVASAETIDNVNIVTNNFDADTGMAGGAAIAVVTKSGTNNLRGSAFFFHNRGRAGTPTRSSTTPTASRSPRSPHRFTAAPLGGPVVKNRLFYFGSYERFYEERGFQETFAVPTERMRNGDFGEVLAAFPNFRIYDPLTGAANGTGREAFPGAVIPANRISSISKLIQDTYPAANAGDLNRNGIADDYVVRRAPIFDRHNYDAKISFNRSSAHQIWGKFSYLDADVQDRFQLGFQDVAPAPTKVKAPVIGHTWTLSPTLILDGNFGVTLNEQSGLAPDYGTNWGSDIWGIPGTNGGDIRQSGQPIISTGMSTLGNVSSWNPYFYTTSVYSFSQALTKVAGRHELRVGYDFNHLEMNHWQPEIGGRSPRFVHLRRQRHGRVGLPARGRVQQLRRLPARPAQRLRQEPPGRGDDDAGVAARHLRARPLAGERQAHAQRRAAVRDVSDDDARRPRHRAPRLQHLERPDRRLGVAIPTTSVSAASPSTSRPASARPTASTTTRCSAPATASPSTRCPGRVRCVASTRPRLPLPTRAAGFGSVGSLEQGIPPIVAPDLSSGAVPLPRGVDMRTPNPDNVDRALLHQWNVTLERRLPVRPRDERRVRRHAEQRRVRRHQPELRRTRHGQRRPPVLRALGGNANILDWGSWTTSKYHSLQVAVNRPFKNGLLLKGAYTWSKAMNETDDDGWTGLTWNIPSQYSRNYARAGYDRTHVLQMGFVYELPWARESTNILGYLIKDWQVNGIFSAFSGTPFTIGGNNPQLLAPGAGAITANQSGDVNVINDPGRDAKWIDPSIFSNPSGLTWGNSGRNAFRRPAVWNLDFSLFRNIPIGRYRVEFRAQASNVLNHTRWLNPDTNQNSPTFMQFVSSGATDAPRIVQLGLRFQF